MRVRGLDNAERAVQTDPTLLRYASAITEQKKCWELLDRKVLLSSVPLNCRAHFRVLSTNLGTFKAGLS